MLPTFSCHFSNGRGRLALAIPVSFAHTQLFPWLCPGQRLGTGPRAGGLPLLLLIFFVVQFAAPFSGSLVAIDCADGRDAAGRALLRRELDAPADGVRRPADRFILNLFRNFFGIRSRKPWRPQSQISKSA